MVASTVDLPAITRQLEYYFSDSNLPRDKFLRAKTEENEHGFVQIDVLLSFKRLQNLGATAAHVGDAAAASSLLAVDEDRARIRRVTPLPAVSLFNTRAVFAKGWLAGSQPPTIEDISQLFSPSGKVLSVRIRRWVDPQGDKHFKGSVFVEMDSAEAAERVVAEQYEIEVPEEGGGILRKQLLLLPVDEYFEMKKEENRSRARRAKNRGEKRKAPGAEPAKVDGETAAAGKDENGGGGEAKLGNTEQGDDRPKRREEDREMKPGLILKFVGFGADVSREDIREAFEPHGEVAWVDFQRGDSEGHIRFAREGAAKEAGEAMTEAKTEFGGNVPTFELLTGEAEEAYWKQMWEKKDQMQENARKRRRENGPRGGGRGGKRFGRGGRGRGRGRGRR